MIAVASATPSRRRGRARAIVSFATVIRLWPSYTDLADDCGVSYQTVASWRRRSSIPQKHWEQIERSARNRHIHGITYDYLRSIAAHCQRAH
jgi:hypothetical protein